MTDQNTAPLDLNGLVERIGQEFDGELHLTEEEGRALIFQAREAERMRGPAVELLAALSSHRKDPTMVNADRVGNARASMDAALAPATGGEE